MNFDRHLDSGTSTVSGSANWAVETEHAFDDETLSTFLLVDGHYVFCITKCIANTQRTNRTPSQISHTSPWRT